ncbi:Mitochondrial transcription rescue factor 1 [Pseudolycoriella hygida]|uniref:Mitochondrial transcription rescue factor 1 n=1 Tax=Pseudolycoriella hygida TaxID=35572 RepID=A0A9Q0MUW6_9DIPT|nr:Mitochondrial transcription rescue factor 1 [Pseudolycoriella hygida]
MSAVTIFSRHLFKTVLSPRYLSYSLRKSTKQSVNHIYLGSRKKLPELVASNSSFQCRFKYNKSSGKQHREEEDDEIDEFTDSDDKDSKTVRVTSLRMDLLIKLGLGLARNKVESAFYDSRIRVNGKKITKKSVTLHVGDEVDVVKGLSPINNDHIIVSRLEIIGVTAKEEDIAVTLRKFKNLTIENYSGQNVFKAVTD